MTNLQINIAIAEACGIVDVDQWGSLYKTASGWVRDCPDYSNDLNAMHEAEKVLTQEQEDKYVMTLCLEVQLESRLHHATARQRAEAFLRTLGKWEEVQP